MIILLLVLIYFVYYYYNYNSIDKFSILGNKNGITLDQREQSREAINKDEYNYIVNNINISPFDK